MIKEIKPEYPDDKVDSQARAEDLFGVLKTAQILGLFFTNVGASIPVNTSPPKNFLEQIKIYNNGTGTIRLYVWDTTASKWQWFNADGTV